MKTSQHAFYGWKSCHNDSLHLNLDSQNSLPQQDVSDGLIDEVPGGLTGVDHVSIGELHGLGSSSTQLSGNNNLTTLGTSLHDESEDTVTSTNVGNEHGVSIQSLPKFNACPTKVNSPPDGQTSQKLVPQRLGLGNGTETSVLDLLSVELQRVLGELESLGNQSGQLPDPPSLLSEDILSVGSTDDDLGLSVGGSDLTSGVTLLGKLAGAIGIIAVLS